MTRNKTAPNWRPNVLGPPGHTGKTAFFKATRTHALKVALVSEEKKIIKKKKLLLKIKKNSNDSLQHIFQKD